MWCVIQAFKQQSDKSAPLNAYFGLQTSGKGGEQRQKAARMVISVQVFAGMLFYAQFSIVQAADRNRLHGLSSIGDQHVKQEKQLPLSDINKPPNAQYVAVICGDNT